MPPGPWLADAEGDGLGLGEGDGLGLGEGDGLGLAKEDGLDPAPGLGVAVHGLPVPPEVGVGVALLACVRLHVGAGDGDDWLVRCGEAPDPCP
jgi:hypothetical protein